MAADSTPPEPEDTPDFLKALLAGDISAWEQLVRDLFPAVLDLLRRRSGDKHKAEDLAQETFLRLWDYFGRLTDTPKGLSDSGNRRAFVLKIAIHLLIDDWRKPRGTKLTDPTDLAEQVPGGPTPLDIIENGELREQVDRFLSSLDERDAQIARLRMFQHYSDPRIEEKLDIPTRTITRRRGKILEEARLFFEHHPDWLRLVERALNSYR